jgi:hypothetical protein
MSMPMFIHSQTPPSVPAMKENRAEISYSFEPLPTGGRVRIKAIPSRSKLFMTFFVFRSKTTRRETQPILALCNVQ